MGFQRTFKECYFLRRMPAISLGCIERRLAGLMFSPSLGVSGRKHKQEPCQSNCGLIRGNARTRSSEGEWETMCQSAFSRSWRCHIRTRKWRTCSRASPRPVLRVPGLPATCRQLAMNLLRITACTTLLCAPDHFRRSSRFLDLRTFLHAHRGHYRHRHPAHGNARVCEHGYD